MDRTLDSSADFENQFSCFPRSALVTAELSAKVLEQPTVVESKVLTGLCADA
jgi:hypothetical protein